MNPWIMDDTPWHRDIFSPKNKWIFWHRRQHINYNREKLNTSRERPKLAPTIRFEISMGPLTIFQKQICFWKIVAFRCDQSFVFKISSHSAKNLVEGFFSTIDTAWQNQNFLAYAFPKKNRIIGACIGGVITEKFCIESPKVFCKGIAREVCRAHNLKTILTL